GVDLAAAVELEGAVGDLDELRPLDLLDGADDVGPVVEVVAEDGDLAQELALARLDDVDRPDVAAGPADRAGEDAEHAGTILDLDPEGHRVLGARRDGRGAHAGARIIGGSLRCAR